MAEVRITAEFKSDLTAVTSDRVYRDILRTLSVLEVIPSMGSLDVPVSLTQLFGEGIRKIPVNPFDIVTQYDPDSDAVNVLGLVHQRMAR